MLLRNGSLSWISSQELYGIFRNGYDLDQLREQLLLKKSYITRNFLENLILTKLYTLSFK